MENVDQWARNTAITAQNAAFVLSAALPMLLKRAEAVAPLTEEEVSLLHQGLSLLDDHANRGVEPARALYEMLAPHIRRPHTNGG